MQEEDYQTKISVRDGIIFLYEPEQPVVEIDSRDIVLIGESNHPEDGWYIILVTKDGGWDAIPWESENIQALIDFLDDRFHFNMDPTILSRTEKQSSVVRFPPQLAGHTLFTSDVLPENKNLLQKIRAFMKVRETSQDVLTQEIKELLSISREKNNPAD
jgi:hypothetical protein